MGWWKEPGLEQAVPELSQLGWGFGVPGGGGRHGLGWEQLVTNLGRFGCGFLREKHRGRTLELGRRRARALSL